MSLTFSDTGKPFELAPEGNHIARCWMILDLGEHPDKHGDVRPKVKISWELCNERMTDGRPFSVSTKYNAYFSERAYLRKDLEKWRGKPFTIEELQGFKLKNVLGAPCMVQVQHKAVGDKTFANVVSVSSVPKGFPVPALVNEPIYFDLDEPGGYDALPDWAKKQINLAPVKVKPPVGQGAPVDYDDSDVDRYTQEDPMDDDIPF